MSVIFYRYDDERPQDDVLVWLERELAAPVEQRRTIIDAHGSYVGQPHSHEHDSGHTYG